MKITPAQLENELVIIAHHLDDMDEGLKDKDYDYVKRGVDDIREAVERLRAFLPKELSAELDRVAEETDQEKIAELI